jgi:tRNA-Thr(GGU) m(6)t(6)A37 methyltransferase TsaA
MTGRLFEITTIGFVRSALQDRSTAPCQGSEGAPEAKLEILSEFLEGLTGIEPGQDIWILTWLHESQRSVLQVHPRGDPQNPLAGVFATRSPDRPNPIGLHRCRILNIGGNCLEVAALEAIDGTPIIDLKPVIESSRDF